MMTLEISPDDVADMGSALETRGEFDRAASAFSRASDLYAFERRTGDAQAMRERARTCRRAAGRHNRRPVLRVVR